MDSFIKKKIAQKILHWINKKNGLNIEYKIKLNQNCNDLILLQTGA